MRKFLSLMVLFSLMSTFPIISSQKELPEHIKKHLNVKPQGQYTCRNLTPEEIAQSIMRTEEEKIDFLRKIVQKEWSAEGLAQFNQMSRQQLLEIYHRSIHAAFGIPQVEPTIIVIPGAHEQALASHNARLRAQMQNSYNAERTAKIKAYDRVAKGTLLFSGGMLALYANAKFNFFSIINFDSKYFGAGCIFGLASSYYVYRKKQTIASMPLKLSEPEIDELLKKFKKAQEQTIKDVCYLQ